MPKVQDYDNVKVINVVRSKTVPGSEATNTSPLNLKFLSLMRKLE
jgi:hypothetical protein